MISFTPTIKPGSGGGTVKASSIAGRYKVLGNMLFLQYQIFATEANGWLDLLLPGSYKAICNNTLDYYCNSGNLETAYVTSGTNNIIMYIRNNVTGAWIFINGFVVI